MERSVIIVGGGVAGLTLARSLALRGVPTRVLEASRTRRVDRGLGIWGRAQVALRKLGLGSTLDTELRIPAAAYRSVDGRWLSRSTDTHANNSRVVALRESALLRALVDGLPRESESGEVVELHQSAEGVTLKLATGVTVEGEIVVGADGANSAIRRLAFGGDSAAAIDTGFVSHGGLLLPSSPGALKSIFAQRASATPSLAFETLSAGRRFAVVPLAGGGGFWFATRPLAVGSVDERADARGMASLRAAYEGWHDPIPTVLHAAACAAAEASMAQEQAAAPAHSMDAFRAERVLMAPPLPAGGRWWTGRCVLVGDAAHALPINLAQGAAASIEGAYLLGEALCAALGAGADGRAGKPPLNDGAWQRAFASYQGSHEARVRQCRLATAFTAALARPTSPPAEAVRNAMRFVPQPLNGLVFDAALEFSLGDVPASTRAAWPLATAPDLPPPR
jgi:2-polyprenyl-6-methoxyphenol hydroxylase-like FAD-dependent oxidoreductase